MAKITVADLLEPEGLALLEGRARDGMTEQEIARSLRINRSTLYRWKSEHPELAAALRKGKEAVDYQVDSPLLHTALSGNTTAQLFWLRNRRPDKWKDKPDPKTDPDLTGGVVLLAPVMDSPGPPDDE